MCLALSLKANVFPQCVSACDCCLPPDSYVAIYSVSCDVIKDNSNVIDHDFASRVDAPLVRAVELLSMRALAQISSDLIVCVEGGPVLLHRVGG